MVTGRNGAGKSSLLRMIAGLVRHRRRAARSLAAASPTPRLAEQAHYLGHQDALKPSLSVAKICSSGPISRRHATPTIEPALARGRSRAAGRPAGRLSVGRAAAAAVDRPPDRRRSGRSGCSTSRPRRSMRRRRTGWPDLMRGHLAGGGMIVAATHGPIGLERARELKLGAGMNAAHRLFVRDMRLAVRVGGGALMGALFFLIVVTHDAVRDRPRPRAARAHRPGDPVARRAAGEPAGARPAVCRPIRRTARSIC